MIAVEKVSGIGEFREEKNKEGGSFYYVGERVFLVVRKATFEVRCDEKLAKLLEEKYESVMRSRYFGRGGIEVVDSGQLEETEVEDLVRLSYNLSLGKE